MTTNADLVLALEARDITPHDLEDTVLALMTDRYSVAMAAVTDEEHRAMLAAACAISTTTLTASGLMFQVAWMADYYKNRKHLEWALSGYLNLPLAA